LFDREGLAAVAAEANDLAEVWSLPLPKDGEAANEELRRFLHWRRRFRADCEQNGWLEPARLRAWQLRAIEAGACRLPARMNFAGSDRHNLKERVDAHAGGRVEVGELSRAARRRLPRPSPNGPTARPNAARWRPGRRTGWREIRWRGCTSPHWHGAPCWPPSTMRCTPRRWHRTPNAAPRQLTRRWPNSIVASSGLRVASGASPRLTLALLRAVLVEADSRARLDVLRGACRRNLSPSGTHGARGATATCASVAVSNI
jgi:hypothetical protein